MGLKTFSEYMNLIGPRYGISQVFSDFLEMTLCALQLGANEPRYLQIAVRYDRVELQVFNQALAALTLEMTGDGSGLQDVLGEFYMREVSRGKNGQFFSPPYVCDMLTGMLRAGGPGKRVADPACGSGRMLLSAAKVSRQVLLYGADNSLVCVHMTCINLCLNGLLGEVAWMDTLSGEWYRGYRIDLHEKGVPWIRQITRLESYLYGRMPECNSRVPSRMGKQLVFHF